MKKLLLFISIFLLTGCLFNMTPSEKVEGLLNDYIKNDSAIMKELDSYIKNEDLNEKQQKKYKEIVKDEYSSIKYEIKKEKINGEKATVDVAITVKDLYKASKETESYLENNPSKFYTDGVYDSSKFIDYRLEEMSKTKDTIDYDITFNLSKKKNKWVIDEMDKDTLEKIHGIYNYENDVE